jgi:hypothetical protein
VRDALSDGRLVEILPAWKHELERGALFALHPDDPGRAVLRHTFLSALEAMAHV